MNGEQRKEQYTVLCTQGKIQSLFLQPWWLNATGSWDVALAYRNNQLVGAMPYNLSRRYGIKHIGMPLFTHHMKLWMDKPANISSHKWLTREKQIIWALIDNLPAYGVFSMVFSEDSFDNWLPFHWKAFRQEVRYTFQIEHSELETLDQNMNRNIKRNIRSGEDIVINHLIEAKQFYELCTGTYQRQKMNMPYDYNSFLKLDTAIVENKSGIKFAAHAPDNSPIAVAYLLWDADKAYYFLAGDNEMGRKSGASILICHEALKYAFEEKQVRVFDFCGSMLEPVTEIRRQFGARSVPLMKIFKAKYRWLDILYQLTHS